MDAEEEHILQSNSENKAFTFYNDANEVVGLLGWVGLGYLGYFVQDIKKILKKSISGREFIFYLVHIMYHKCHKINFRHGGSYVDSSDCINKEKATVNPKNKDDKCFQMW